jgi:riboflavin kinase/FMN adenylyltransferase
MTFNCRAREADAPTNSSDRILVDRPGGVGRVVGFNFHFGRMRAGSPAFLHRRAEHGFRRHRAGVHPWQGPAGLVGADPRALASGDVATAATCSAIRGS